MAQAIYGKRTCACIWHRRSNERGATAAPRKPFDFPENPLKAGLGKTPSPKNPAKIPKTRWPTGISTGSYGYLTRNRRPRGRTVDARPGVQSRGKIRREQKSGASELRGKRAEFRPGRHEKSVDPANLPRLCAPGFFARQPGPEIWAFFGPRWAGLLLAVTVPPERAAAARPSDRILRYAAAACGCLMALGSLERCENLGFGIDLLWKYECDPRGRFRAALPGVSGWLGIFDGFFRVAFPGWLLIRL